MKLFKSFNFCQRESQVFQENTAYMLNLYKVHKSFTLFGNADLLTDYEQILVDEILNDGLVQSLRKIFFTNSEKLRRDATYMRGMNFFITGIKDQDLALKFFDMAVEHFSKYTDAYALTRMYIKWENAPEWVQYWIALPSRKAVFSDQKPILNQDGTAWLFPNGSKQIEAENMHYIGDWRKLIAKRSVQPYTMVVSKNFKASQYRNQYNEDITYEQALNEGVILSPLSSNFSHLSRSLDLQMSISN